MTLPARQLILDLPVRASLAREDFLVSPSNEAAYAFVERWPDWPGHGALIIGPPGSGKTHLAAIWANEAGAVIVPASALREDAVPQLLATGAVAVEDADETGPGEVALFHLINAAREMAASILVTARTPPAAWGLSTPDLTSRLRALPSVAIDLPDEALLGSLLVKLFIDRQLVVDTSIVDMLVHRLDRSFAAARSAVAALDREALSRGRRITRAMVADVLVDGGGDDACDKQTS
jgi:chromosomal replication initiation ATPase DnaA